MVGGLVTNPMCCIHLFDRAKDKLEPIEWIIWLPEFQWRHFHGNQKWSYKPLQEDCSFLLF
jgi:hypothetical protein